MRPKDKRDYRGDLRGLLLAQVGQPWNDVYSKLCRTFDTRNGRDQEVMRQLRWLVEQHCEIVGGEVCDSALSRRSAKPYPVRGLYVHPETGLLCNNEPDAKVRPKSPVESFDLDNTTSYTRIEGIWYRLIFEYHGPDEIWKTYRFRDMEPGRPDAEYVTRTYGAELRHPGDVRHVYYREVPHLQRRPLAKGGKLQCGRKETEWVEFYLATGKLEMRSQIAENATMLRSRLVRARATRPPLNHAAAEVPAVSNPHLLAGHLPAPVPQRAAF